MPIADFTPQSAEVPFQGGSFTVRGLNMTDISVLMKLHLEDLVLLTQRYQGMPEVQGLGPVLELISGFPGLAANILALAADEDDATPFGRLPFGLQALALQKVGDLTFEDFGGPGKLWAAVGTVWKAVAVTPEDVTTLLPN